MIVIENTIHKELNSMGRLKKKQTLTLFLLAFKTELVTINHKDSKKLHSAFVTLIGQGMFKCPQNTG